MDNLQVTVTETSEKDVEQFERAAWKSEDIGHYGREVEWSEWKPDFFVFKAEKEGGVVGVIGGYQIAGVLFIERVIVLPSERGKGVGKALMVKAEAEAIDRGAHKSYLYTGKDWESNEFYKELDYTKSGDLPLHFFKKDFVIYSKNLE